MRRRLLASALWLCVLGAGLGVVIAAGALLTAAATAGVFNTRPGTWTTPLAPIHRMPTLSLRVNVPGVVRLVLSPIGQRLLDGGARSTALGHLAFRRHGSTLVVTCTPCRIDDVRVAAQAIAVPLELRLTPDPGAEGNARITGTLAAPGLLAQFAATLAPDRIDVGWSVPSTELAVLVRVFAEAIPEAAVAQVDGRFAAHGTLRLPALTAGASLSLEGLEVAGLGTEALADGMFEQTCTERDGSLRRIINGPVRASGCRLHRSATGCRPRYSRPRTSASSRTPDTTRRRSHPP